MTTQGEAITFVTKAYDMSGHLIDRFEFVAEDVIDVEDNEDAVCGFMQDTVRNTLEGE